MFLAERLAKIKEVLLEYKHIDVTTLASLLSVSLATVRRDLDRLEETGFLIKTYGGAILNESAKDEIVLSQVDDPYYDDKDQIAQICSKLIKPSDIIFLGYGSIPALIARHIKQMENIKVITNSLAVINELTAMPGSAVVVPGGTIEKVDNIYSFVGSYSLNNVQNMFITKAFLSADGATISNGYTCMNESIIDFYRHILKSAEKSFMAIEYSKFSKRSFCSFAELNEIDTVITNVQLSDHYKDYFSQNNIKVFIGYSDIYV